MKIVLFIMGGILAVTLIALVLLFFFKRQKTTTPSTSVSTTGTVKNKNSDKEKEIAILVLKVVAILGLFYFFFPSFLWIFKKPLTWVNIGGLTILEYITKTDKQKKRSTLLGNLIFSLLLVGNIWYFFGGGFELWLNETKRKAEISKSEARVTKVSPKMVFDSDVEAMTKKILFESLPVSKAAQLYFVIGAESSGYNQFDKDGNVIKNGTATCVAQIKTDVWGKKAEELGLDISKTEDCLRMAVWIMKNDSRGIDNWAPSIPKIAGATFVEFGASSEYWSENHSVRPRCSLATNGKTIDIKFEDDEVVEAFPGSYPKMKGNTFWIRSDDEAASLIYLCS